MTQRAMSIAPNGGANRGSAGLMALATARAQPSAGSPSWQFAPAGSEVNSRIGSAGSSALPDADFDDEAGLVVTKPGADAVVDSALDELAADPRLEQEERAADMVGIPTISIAGFSGVSVGQGGTPWDDRWLTTPVSTRSLCAKAHDRRWPAQGGAGGNPARGRFMRLQGWHVGGR